MNETRPTAAGRKWVRPDPFAPMNLGDVARPGPDPDRVSLIDLSDPTLPEGRTFTAADLDAEIDAVGQALLAHGLVRGDRVGVLAANSAAQVALYFGAMRAGIAAVPINWKLARDTIGYIVRDADVRLLVVDAERHPLAPADGVERLEIGTDAWDAFLASGRAAGRLASIVPDPEEIAQILYTSGSTGPPKGVPLSHAGQWWATAMISSPDLATHTAIVAAPMYHMNALFNLKLAFQNGARVVLQAGFKADTFVTAMERHGVTRVTGVPTMFALLANLVGDGPPPAAFARVTSVIMGSSPFSQDLLDRVRRLFPNAVVDNWYGTTEAGPAVFGPTPDGRHAPDLAMGYPIPGSECRLVDEATGAVIEGPGEGVFEMRNPATMRGYLNRPDKTAAALSADGWYRSGDVARRDEEGVYWFVGRADDMFVCGGENVWPAEVERRLEDHPGIVQAVVVSIPDEVKQALPVAFVVRRPGSDLDEEAVKAHALATGPAYAHPRRVWFIEGVPLAGTNKIDRAALAREARERAGVS